MVADEAVVVGAGPNGLSAAIRLARAGLGVRVFEAADRPGGGARSEALTLPGFLHDVCSAAHPMGASSPCFRAYGLERLGLAWVHPPFPAAHPLEDGAAAVLAPTVDETAERLGGADGSAYRRLMGPLTADAGALLAGALASPLRIPEHPLVMLRLARAGLRAADRLAERRFASARARALFLGMAAHAPVPLSAAPSAAFGLVLMVAGHASGWPFARGGSERITDALVAALSSAGGSVAASTPIRSLTDLPPSATTVLNLTPRQVLAVAGERLPRGYRARLERFRYGPGVFKVDWALSEPIPWTAPECRQAGTVHLGTPRELRAASEADRLGRAADPPFVILTQPTSFDPSRAPDGKHVAWAYCRVPHGSTLDRTDAIERQVERFAPGFRDVILARHTMGPGALERRNGNLVGGDVGGGLQDLAQLFFRPVPRLDPWSTPAAGLYLCSASTPPGGGVHGMCGYHAAGSALRRMGRG